MELERSAVQWGRTRIEFDVRRSNRRKTVAVAVQPDASVLLTAPEGVDLARLEKIVREKAAWIAERKRRHRDREPPANQRSYVSGESLLYLGRHYRLKIRRVPAPGPAKLERGHLVVEVLRGLSDEDREHEARLQITKWYREHAEKRLTERSEQWAAALRLRPSKLLIRSQAKRWGSCDKDGVIRLNWKIIQAPMRLVDYVVAHELVHLEHQDHTKAFWAKLGSVMPDYETRRADLGKLGPRLDGD